MLLKDRGWALVPLAARRWLRRARLSLWSLADRLVGRIPARGYGGLIGQGDFDEVGAEFLGHFKELGGLQPSDDVLDIGCGVGRMAAPLTSYLTTGAYRGFDVVQPMVESCRRRFGGFATFRFEHVDVFNGKYNPGGSIPPTEFRFPYADACFDFAFAVSVFTHMLEDDVERYLAETARVLRPGGRFLATWFVMTPEAADRVNQGKSDVPFGIRRGSFWVADGRELERAVAYGPETVRKIYDGVHLRIEEPIRRGTWSGATGLSYQDIVLARRG